MKQIHSKIIHGAIRNTALRDASVAPFLSSATLGAIRVPSTHQPSTIDVSAGSRGGHGTRCTSTCLTVHIASRPSFPGHPSPVILPRTSAPDRQNHRLAGLRSDTRLKDHAWNHPQHSPARRFCRSTPLVGSSCPQFPSSSLTSRPGSRGCSGSLIVDVAASQLLKMPSTTQARRDPNRILLHRQPRLDS